MYAVFDVAVTGPGVGWEDRVAEIGVVRLDRLGRTLDEWSGLVRTPGPAPVRGAHPGAPIHGAAPGGPVHGAAPGGPVHGAVSGGPVRGAAPGGPADGTAAGAPVHGIAPGELAAAPTFGQVAGRVAGMLRGHTVVAHNLPFRAALLGDEFARLGLRVPLDSGLCTMRLARHFLPTASRGLDACRAAAGLPPHRTDAALPDARATADLMAFYLRATGCPPPWLPIVDEAATATWPDISEKSDSPLRTYAGVRDRTFLNRLVERLPRMPDPSVDAYLDVIDRLVVDGLGGCDFGQTALRLGVPGEAIGALHRRYLAELASAAIDLGLTEDGRRDLRFAATLLNLRPEAADDALADARTSSIDPESPWQLHAGDTVVFLGAMNPSRERWLSEARDAGLIVGNAVTRKTRLLVTADPDSRTGNAEKARRYQVPIVHPAAYREILRRAGPNRISRFG